MNAPSRRMRQTTLAVLVGFAVLAGCTARGAGKTGGKPQHAQNGTVTLSFAAAEPRRVDTDFALAVAAVSGGHLKVRPVAYDARSTGVDNAIAKDLTSGKLDLGDVSSRVWESFGVQAFRAYQDPFVITSRALLDQAVTGTVGVDLLKTLKDAHVTGLAIVPRSVRYLYSTRPLTTPAQFQGATIRVNPSPTTEGIVAALGAKADTATASGQPTVQALRAGTLTAVESDPESALVNDYVRAAPYVLVNAPLFAKASTLVLSNAKLSSISAQAVSWLRHAAEQVAAGDGGDAEDRTSWAQACAEGLKAQTVTPAQLEALRVAESPVYGDLAADQQTALAVDRIGLLTAKAARLDRWATCDGAGIRASSTKVLDGTYRLTVKPADLDPGDCTTCGNDGQFTLVVHDGRYALLHPTPADADPNDPSNSFYAAWQPGDPIEAGSVIVTGARSAWRPEANQQFGSSPFVYDFEIFRDRLTFRPVSGSGLNSARAWTN